MKIVFANESEIPEHLKKDAVKQEDGTYIYEGDGLVKKNSQLLDENKKLKGLADLVKGLDASQLTPEKIKQALDEMDQAGARENAILERIAAAVTENTKKHKGDIEKAVKERDNMRVSLEKYLIDSHLTSAISAEKGNARFIAPVLRNRLKVMEKDGNYEVRVLNEKGEIDLDSNGAPVTVAALVASAKKDPEFASVFAAPAASGTGTTPGTPGARSGSAVTTPGAVVADASGIVTLTRQQYKDPVVYRQALGLVKNDYSKVVIGPETATA